MRVRVKDEEHAFTILLPTNLIFSKGTVWLANFFGRKYAGDSMKDIPPEAVDKLFSEIRNMKRRYGRWELVEVNGADGSYVSIVL